MNKLDPVITGIGVVLSGGIGKEAFRQNLEKGKSCTGPAGNIPANGVRSAVVGEVRGFNSGNPPGTEGLRNVDRSKLFYPAASQQSIDDTRAAITENNADSYGAIAGTIFLHISPGDEFDREASGKGRGFATPALFFAAVINSPSSQVYIRYNIQQLNIALSACSTSSLTSPEDAHGAFLRAGTIDFWRRRAA